MAEEAFMNIISVGKQNYGVWSEFRVVKHDLFYQLAWI